MNAKKIKQYILRIKDSFIEETDENRQMLDIYMKHLEGSSTGNDINKANRQLKQVFKSFGMGILLILPFSPISIPYVLEKAKELEIELIPDWYKALRKDEDSLE